MNARRYPPCTLRRVKKTSIYLSEREIARFAWLVEQEERSQAAIVREAIAAYTSPRRRDRELRLIGSGEGPGGSVADVPEEELLAGFGG